MLWGGAIILGGLWGEWGVGMGVCEGGLGVWVPEVALGGGLGIVMGVGVVGLWG